MKRARSRKRVSIDPVEKRRDWIFYMGFAQVRVWNCACAFQSGTTWARPCHDLWHDLKGHQTPVNIALARRHDLYPRKQGGGKTRRRGDGETRRHNFTFQQLQEMRGRRRKMEEGRDVSETAMRTEFPGFYLPSAVSNLPPSAGTVSAPFWCGSGLRFPLFARFSCKRVPVSTTVPLRHYTTPFPGY